jgi:formate dehydrogenase subunit gamma
VSFAGLGPEMASGSELARFDLVERLVHWSTAIMMLTLIVTGAILYLPALALRVGHRSLIENIHVITGLSLLGPLVLGVVGPWRKRLIRDLRRLDRWGCRAPVFRSRSSEHQMQVGFGKIAQECL